MSRRVVITGLGCLSAAGTEIDPHRRAFHDGSDLATPERLVLGGGEWLETRVARFPEFDRGALISPAGQRRMSLLSQNWVVACLKARADARLNAAQNTGFAGGVRAGRSAAQPDQAAVDASGAPAPERTGVFLGTGFGCLQCTAEYLDGVQRDGLGLGSPFLFSESVANAPAGHAAIELVCRGPNLTLTCGDAAGMAAVEAGARAIRQGRADAVYAGGAEQMTAPLLAVLARLGASAGTGKHEGRRWRVPGAASNAHFPGEGAACLLLEERERALARGARPYAEVKMGAMLSDPEADASGWSRSVRPRAAALRRALECSRLSPDDVDGVLLHACGDPEADRAEAQALTGVLESERSPGVPTLSLFSPARVVGRFAAAGALSVAAAALSLRYQEPYVDGGSARQEGDAELSVTRLARPRGGGAREIRNILLSAASWGGSCMGLVLGRP